MDLLNRMISRPNQWRSVAEASYRKRIVGAAAWLSGCGLLLGSVAAQTVPPKPAVAPNAEAPKSQPAPGSPEALIRQGQAYEAQGFLDRAMDAYKEAIMANPRLAEAHARLGVAYARKGLLDSAIEALTHAVNNSPETDRYHYDLAVAYDRKEMFDKAIEEYQKVVKLNPNYLEAFNNLGTIFNLRDRLDEAIAAYKNAIRIRPEVARLHYNLGIVYVRKGLFNHALQEYTEAVRYDPTLAEAYNNMGVVYSQTWQFSKAAEAFKKALEIKTDMREARENLQETERDQKLLEDLIVEYKNTLAGHPNDRDTWTALGIAYVRKNDIDQAMAAFGKAQKLPAAPAAKTQLSAAPRRDPSARTDKSPAAGATAPPTASESPHQTAAPDGKKATSVVDMFPAGKGTPPDRSVPGKVRTSDAIKETAGAPREPASGVETKSVAKPESKPLRETKAAPARPTDTSAARLTTSKPDKTMQTSEMIKASAAKPFALQVGVHREQEKAEEVVKALRAKGITAQVIRADTADRGIWYQVRVGAFPSFVEARDYGEKLKVQHLIDTFTVTRPSRTDN